MKVLFRPTYDDSKVEVAIEAKGPQMDDAVTHNGTDKTDGGKQSENNGRSGNLIPFKPGQSGNPKGRPRGNSIRRLVRRYGLETMVHVAEPDGTKKQLRAIDDAIRTVYEQARKGNMKAAKILFDILCPQKGNRVLIEQNTIDLSFQLDRPPDGNAQLEMYEQIKNGTRPSCIGRDRHSESDRPSDGTLDAPIINVAPETGCR